MRIAAEKTAIATLALRESTAKKRKSQQDASEPSDPDPSTEASYMVRVRVRARFQFPKTLVSHQSPVQLSIVHVQVQVSSVFRVRVQ